MQGSKPQHQSFCPSYGLTQSWRHSPNRFNLFSALLLQGLIQNQSFYPYYGSTQKLVYQADALSSNIYSSSFVPYTTFSLPDVYPPAFMPGSPTALQINDTSFVLSVAFYEAATVSYVVVMAASVSLTATSCIFFQVWHEAAQF